MTTFHCAQETSFPPASCIHPIHHSLGYYQTHLPQPRTIDSMPQGHLPSSRATFGFNQRSAAERVRLFGCGLTWNHIDIVGKNTFVSLSIIAVVQELKARSFVCIVHATSDKCHNTIDTVSLSSSLLDKIRCRTEHVIEKRCSNFNSGAKFD